MDSTYGIGRTQQMLAIDTIQRATFGSASGPPGISQETINSVASLAESQTQATRVLNTTQPTISQLNSPTADGYNRTGSATTNSVGSTLDVSV